MNGAAQVFTHEAGVIDVDGRFSMTGGTFNSNGGSIWGTVLLDSAALNIRQDPASGAPGDFTIQGNSTLSGDINPWTSVRVEARYLQNAVLTWSTEDPFDVFTNRGTITVVSTSNNFNSTLVMNGPLINAGVINTENPQVGGGRTINADLVNNGTVNINANATLIGVQTSNNTVNVATGRNLTLGGTGPVFNQDGGTLAISGTVTMNSGTFNFNGGEVGGTAVLNSSALNLRSGSGAVSFNMPGNSTLSGDIKAGQTVRVQSNYPVVSILTAATGFTNAGTITLFAGSSINSSLVVSSGTLVNTGVINAIAGAGVRRIIAEVDNQGAINISYATTLGRAGAAHSNSGAISVSGGNLTLSLSGSTFTNTGTIGISAGRTMLVTRGIFRNVPPGTISGGGTLELRGVVFYGAGNVSVDIINAGSQMNVGSSPGILNITGDYTQDSEGVLNIEVGGAPGSGSDQFNVSGRASLAGTLNFSLIDGFSPAPCFRLPYLAFASRSGDFSTVNGLGLGGGLSFRRVASATGYTLVAYNTGSRVNIAPASLSVAEGGASASYGVCLAAAPTANVTVTASPDSQVEVTRALVVFTPSAWQDAQTIAVSAVDDTVPEGSHTGVVTHTSSSTDASYNNLALPSVTATITDNDTRPTAVTLSSFGVGSGTGGWPPAGVVSAVVVALGGAGVWGVRKRL